MPSSEPPLRRFLDVDTNDACVSHMRHQSTFQQIASNGESFTPGLLFGCVDAQSARSSLHGKLIVARIKCACRSVLITCTRRSAVSRYGSPTRSMLRSANTPVVLNKGARDRSCCRARRRARRQMLVQTKICVVNEGNHSLILGACRARRDHQAQVAPVCHVVSSIEELFKRTDSRGGLQGGFARRNTIC